MYSFSCKKNVFTCLHIAVTESDKEEGGGGGREQPWLLLPPVSPSLLWDKRPVSSFRSRLCGHRGGPGSGETARLGRSEAGPLRLSGESMNDGKCFFAGPSRMTCLTQDPPPPPPQLLPFPRRCLTRHRRRLPFLSPLAPCFVLRFPSWLPRSRGASAVEVAPVASDAPVKGIPEEDSLPWGVVAGTQG